MTTDHDPDDPTDRALLPDPVACTLPAADVASRMDRWREVLGFVTKREAIADGGLRLSLRPDVRFDELARLVVAEQDCCRFFAFAMTVDESGIALEVRAPDAAVDVVAALFGAES